MAGGKVVPLSSGPFEAPIAKLFSAKDRPSQVSIEREARRVFIIGKSRRVSMVDIKPNLVPSIATPLKILAGLDITGKTPQKGMINQGFFIGFLVNVRKYDGEEVLFLRPPKNTASRQVR